MKKYLLSFDPPIDVDVDSITEWFDSRTDEPASHRFGVVAGYGDDWRSHLYVHYAMPEGLSLSQLMEKWGWERDES